MSPKQQIDLLKIRRFEIFVRPGGIEDRLRPLGMSNQLRAICQNKEVDFNPPATEIDDLCEQLNAFLTRFKAEE